ncbi:50S ribosomal protein L24 [Thermosediminibacter litoriperuensis]|uniref:Large ribosomal subunit protein uL24 n=1 Tax=Thermosediminibacter litoriperuensis TaxID=291989 RepID=A0A5S5AL05_9FIRM|nr:50S ribosomal protein L24 [Thermosediminibacter litoriperuensis]TYP50318.1 LSU ribosomal protein L24P [Thermosediminibacter litoriperuensis]
MAKVHVKKGDTVVVLSGKDKGKKGKVLKVLSKKGTAIVEGVNMATKHRRPSPKFPQGGIIHQELPLSTSKLMVVCGKCGAPTRIGHTVLADGTKVRTCKKCGEVIDK